MTLSPWVLAFTHLCVLIVGFYARMLFDKDTGEL